MMASGTINGSTNNSHYTLTCEWSSTSNQQANTSSVTAIVYLNGNGYATTSSYWSCVINGTTVTSGKSATINSKTELGRRTWTLNHNSDGSCSFNISFSFSNGISSPSTYVVTSGSGNNTITLDKIARGSTFTLSQNYATLGAESITVTISKAVSSYTHTVVYKFGTIWSEMLVKSSATTCTISPAKGDANQIPNSLSGVGQIILITYNGNTEVTRSSQNITLWVSGDMQPSTNISVTSNDGLGNANVAGKTTFTVKPSGATGSYGSTIKNYLITGGGLNTTSSNGGTTGTLGAGDYVFTVKVTDSRGRTATKTQTVTVLDYKVPSFRASVLRCNSLSQLTNDGEYAFCSINYNVLNVNDNNANVKQYKIESKLSTSSTWSVTTNWTNFETYSGTIGINIGEFSGASNYNVKISVKDSYNVVEQMFNLSSTFAYIDVEETGVAIGGINQGLGALELYGDLYISKNRIAHVAEHSGTDLGSLNFHTAILSSDNPTWFDGTSNNNKIYNEKYKPVSPTEPLVHGSWFMNESQTVNLPKKISECQHGICICWKDYNGTEVKNKDIVYTFIPRGHSTRNDGKPLAVLLPIYEKGSSAITKNIYVYDNKITGCETNSSETNSWMVVLTDIYEV